MVIGEPLSELRSWPNSIEWGGLTLAQEYTGEEVAYTTTVDHQGLGFYVHLRYNQSLFRKKEEYNTPYEANIDIFQGRKSNFNPAIFSLRITDKGQENVGRTGHKRVEIGIQYSQGNRGANYALEAINGRQVSASIDEWERPNEHNHWQTPAVTKPSMYDESIEEGRERIDVTNPQFHRVLDQLGLPATFWGGDESHTDFLRKSPTVKPFPELLQNMEQLVKNLTQHKSGFQLSPVVPKLSGR